MAMPGQLRHSFDRRALAIKRCAVISGKVHARPRLFLAIERERSSVYGARGGC